MYIYKWTNKINGKIYVGKTTRTIKERLRGYKDDIKSVEKGTYKHKFPIVFALHKYGIDNFIFEVIDIASDNIELNIKETDWIAKLDACNKEIGYNCLKGGNDGWLGRKHTQESKDKMSKTRKGKWQGGINPKSKMNDTDKDNMIIDFNNSLNILDLSAKYKIHRTQVLRILKSRGITVKNNHNSKITMEIANQIRLDRQTNKITMQKLAEKYNLSAACICKIINNELWTS